MNVSTRNCDHITSRGLLEGKLPPCQGILILCLFLCFLLETIHSFRQAFCFFLFLCPQYTLYCLACAKHSEKDALDLMNE